MVAYHALVDEPAHNTAHLVLGPELLSYDDVRDSLYKYIIVATLMIMQSKVAEILSKALGRKISHVRISEEEVAADLQSAGGLEPGYARMLAALDTAVANGIEERLNEKVLQITGRSPKAFKEFVEANKAVWT
jgi:festuclavine dehydrogenase